MDIIDTTRPNCARVWDCLLGGKDNFAADREAARKMLAIDPGLAEMARMDRLFLGSAAARAAGDGGISQFIDLGAGMPAPLPLHKVVRSVCPLARCVYVDHDPVVTVHVAALQATDDRLGTLEADLTRPGQVLAAPALLGVIDLRRPVCVVLGAVLHYLPAGQARQVVQGYAERLAPGSWFAVSVACYADPALLARLRREHPGTFFSHSPEDLAAILGGLQIVPPGIAEAGRWVSGEGGVPGGGASFALCAAAVSAAGTLGHR